MLRLHHVATALALAVPALAASAQTSNFSNFIGLPSSVAAGSLPESAPFQLANSASYFSGGTNAVLRVGDGNTANATGAFNWVPFTNASGVALPVQTRADVHLEPAQAETP